MGGSGRKGDWEPKSSKSGGWKGDGRWWPDEDKGRGSKGRKGLRSSAATTESWSKKAETSEWSGTKAEGQWNSQWVPKESKEKWRGKGNSKDQDRDRDRDHPKEERQRSQLSSSAPDFKPSGMSAMYESNFSVAVLPSNVMPPPLPPSPSYTMPPPPPPLHIEMPQLWQEFADADGTKYYYNAKTGLSQWERPREWDQMERNERERVERAERAERQRQERLAAGAAREDEMKKPPLRREDPAPSGEKGDKGDGKGKKRQKKPQSVEKEKEPSFGPPGCNLFVFHLPDDWADEDLLEYFTPHGTVVSAKVMKELGTGRSRGFGFVSYEDRVSAATAIKKMQGYKILGKRLKVEFKKGEGDNGNEKLELEEKSTGDDERLIGYLRAISAKSVVQSLKENEKEDKGIASDVESDEDDPKASLRDTT